VTEEATSIAVVGAGIGGLTAALSLHRAGFDVHVYEQASTVSEVGAGIQVSPNASRILHGLGLADDLAEMGVCPLAWHQRRWQDGRTLVRAPLGGAVVEAFGFPHYQMHRADLLATLLRALPAERVHIGRRLVGLTDHGERVEARFEDGDTVTADVLVGADGIHSAVRETLFGPQDARFTGCAAYRGLIPSERLADLELEVTSQVWMGPGKHFVHYYVQDERLVNFVAVVEQDSWTRESWTDQGDVAAALAEYDGWHPQVRTILGSVDRTFVWALFDRAPLERWSVGRVTLLGDACHPMLPFMAQGAAQAVEDGATLTACLQREADVSSALELYERLRLPRASKIQGLSAANKIRFHLDDGREQEERDARMASGSTDWSLKAVAWIYGHDASDIDAMERGV
jgi:2-polyprenyl-6-methoxyphenol hydroxylase-like FAD-dependent oxidoreductase